MGDTPLSTTLAGALGAPLRELAPLGGSFAGQLFRVRSAAEARCFESSATAVADG
jgi:hypothetical protein